MASTIYENGFHLKRFEDIYKEYQDEYRAEFGEDVDLSDDNIIMQQIKIRAKQESDFNELAQICYNSFNPGNAKGLALDALCALSGTKRLLALPTVVPVVCRGDENTPIPEGSLISKNTGDFTFTINEDVFLSRTACTEVFFVISDVVDSTDYSLSINNDSFAIFTYNSGVGASENSILQGLRDEINAGALPVTAIIVGTRLRIYSNDLTFTNMTVQNLSTDVLNLSEIGCHVFANCTITGPIVINPGEVTVISKSVSGWNSVVNLLVGITGRDRETDEELEARRRDNLQITESSTDMGIEKALLQNVQGVTKAIVVSNRTADTDATGQPGKTFQAVVEGGTDLDVAIEIFNSQPSGILSYGNTEITIIDGEGYPQDIQFSRPEPVYFWVNLTYTTDGSEGATSLASTIAEALVTQANILYDIGTDVYRQKIYQSIMSVPAVTSVPLLELAYQSDLTPVPDPGDYSENNIIEIQRFEKAVFSVDNIASAKV